MRGCNSGCHGLRLVPSYRCSITTRHPAGRYLARARPAVSVRLRRSSEWGGHTHPPLHRASAPKTLVCSECLAVRPFASSLYRFQVCYLAVGLIYPPLRLRLCLGFWSLLARCSSPHPRSVFHFRFLVHSWLVRLRGPASVQRSLARYPARPEGIYFMHAPVSGQAHGSAARSAAARRLYIAFHFRFRASLHANSNARVLDCLSSFPDLLDFSFLFQCREIPCRCCVRDV